MRTRTARLVTPIALILCWLLAGGIGGPFFGKVSEVARNDQASFLPTSAEATVVGQRYRDFVGNDQIPAIAVFTGENPLTETQKQAVVALGQDLGSVEGIAAVSPPITSEDSMAVQVFVGVDATANVSRTVNSVRDVIAAHDLGDWTSTSRVQQDSPATFRGPSAASTACCCSWPSAWCW